jgi:hypothetical protein
VQDRRQFDAGSRGVNHCFQDVEVPHRGAILDPCGKRGIKCGRNWRLYALRWSLTKLRGPTLSATLAADEEINPSPPLSRYFCRCLNVQLREPIFDFHTTTWETASQEAAFEGRCFCMLDSGRILNRDVMPPATPHWNPRLRNEHRNDHRGRDPQAVWQRASFRPYI